MLFQFDRLQYVVRAGKISGSVEIEAGLSVMISEIIDGVDRKTPGLAYTGVKSISGEFWLMITHIWVY